MKISSTFIKDLFLIEPSIIKDKRGYFMESYRDDIFNSRFPHLNFCQENESKSKYGVLRGLHYQLPPYAQTKLVRVISGKVLDVAVDIRQGSETFGNYFSVELSGNNKKQLLIPRGFAHGFVVLSKEAIFSYKVDSYYNKGCDRGIIYNDKSLKIDWKLANTDLNISTKDIKLPELKDAEYFNYFHNLYE